MSNWAQRRGTLFMAGCGLLLAGGVGLFYVGSHFTLWVRSTSFQMAGVWLWCGIVCTALAALLVLCGRGWSRWLLEVIALVELYCWWSYLTLAVQLR